MKKSCLPLASGLLLLIGIIGGDPIPQSCVTPSGSAGQCVPLDQCSNLYAIKLLSPPNSQDDLLERAKCYGLPLGTGVCCQPERVLSLFHLCGKIDYERVSNGNEASFSQFPWMALLMYRNTLEDKLTPNCGGSLISDRYVLTAAHCLMEKEDLKLEIVRLGEHTISTPIDCNELIYGKECGPVEDVAIESMIKHGDYRRKFGGHDIGLIRLAREVIFKVYIQPICLPLHQTLKDVLLHMYSIAGWGYTEGMERSDILQWADLQRVDTPACQMQIDNLLKTSRKKIKVEISDKQICAGAHNFIDSCQGDSGGPLMGRAFVPDMDMIKPRYVLFGVVSFGIETCGVSNFPGVYTRVGSYLGWIISNMKA